MRAEKGCGNGKSVVGGAHKGQDAGGLISGLCFLIRLAVFLINPVNVSQSCEAYDKKKPEHFNRSGIHGGKCQNVEPKRCNAIIVT